MSRPGVNLYDADSNTFKVSKFILDLLKDGHIIVTSDFKLFLNSFNIQTYRERLNVYDTMLPEIKIPSNFEDAKLLLEKILKAMAGATIYEWQKLIANAAVVYTSLERSGVMLSGYAKYPKWSQRTYSGRSKTLGFNIQGASASDNITNSYGSPSDLFIHFDWRAADIRAAALLSCDDHLLRACDNVDPYQVTADYLNNGQVNGLSRDECKIALLSTINSMNVDAHILDAFPTMRKWISDSIMKLRRGEPLVSLLGRKFIRVKGRSDLSVFNATMQGTIAHAMQASVRRIWEVVGDQLLAEVHDSVIVTCPNNGACVKSMINTVVDIMVRPFSGLLDEDLVFPVRVSIGKKWKQWQELRVYS